MHKRERKRRQIPSARRPGLHRRIHRKDEHEAYSYRGGSTRQFFTSLLIITYSWWDHLHTFRPLGGTSMRYCRLPRDMKRSVYEKTWTNLKTLPPAPGYLYDVRIFEEIAPDLEWMSASPDAVWPSDTWQLQSLQSTRSTGLARFRRRALPIDTRRRPKASPSHKLFALDSSPVFTSPCTLAAS